MDYGSRGVYGCLKFSMTQTSPQEQHQHHSLSGGGAGEMREMRGGDLDWYRIGGMGIANGVERIIGREVSSS